MTTFVSLAPDSDGTASAVAVGDWLLQIIKSYDTSQDSKVTKEYHQQFLNHFLHDDVDGESKTPEPLQLLQLLLSQHALVFRWLHDIKAQGDPSPQQPNAEAKADGRKSFGEASREVEDFFMLLMSMVVLRISNVEQAGVAAGELCDAFKMEKSFPEFRLKLLMALYNVFPPTFPYRFPIFLAICEYAAENNLFTLVVPYAKYVNEWMKDWNLTPSYKRQVYLMLANELKKLNRLDEAYQYLKKHVQYFQGEKEQVLAEGATISAALELAEDSIKLPDHIYFDVVLGLDAVRHLQHTPHRLIFSLLAIMARQGPRELEELHREHPTLMETHGIDYDACMEKLRLLSVASLVSRRKQLGFKQLSDAFKLPEEEAEALIVQAIGKNIIHAKVDQTNRVVHIRSSILREFGRAQWEDVLERLEHWSDGIRTLLSCMTTVKQGGVGNTMGSTLTI